MTKSGNAGIGQAAAAVKGKSPVGGSMPQGTAVGSGSRPGKGRTTLESAASSDAKTMSRDVSGQSK